MRSVATHAGVYLRALRAAMVETYISLVCESNITTYMMSCGCVGAQYSHHHAHTNKYIDIMMPMHIYDTANISTAEISLTEQLLKALPRSLYPEKRSPIMEVVACVTEGCTTV